MYLSAISSIRSLRRRANARASRSASAPVVVSSRWHASRGNFASTGTTPSPVSPGRPPGEGGGIPLLWGGGAPPLARGGRRGGGGAGGLGGAGGWGRVRGRGGDGLVAPPDQEGRHPAGPRARRFERLGQP